MTRTLPFPPVPPSKTPPPPPPDSPAPKRSDDVYDLGSVSEADEIEKARAIEEVVNLAAKKPRSAPPPPVTPKPASSPAPMPRVTHRAASSPPTIRQTPDIPVLRAPNVTTDEDRERVVRDVVAHATTVEWETAAAKPMQSYRLRPIVLFTTCIVAVLLSAYTFAARPEWVYGPDPARVAPARREGHMRFAMYLTAQRLQAYSDANGGALPASLTQLGENWPGLRYRAIGGGTFELEAFEGLRRPFSFRSDGSLRTLRDASLPHLRTVNP